MADADQSGVRAMVAFLFVLLPFLLVGPARPRRALAEAGARLLTWALPHLQWTDPDVDPRAVAAEAEARRRERLVADLHRVRLLLRDDAAMSATRQLANRIAYDWLRREAAGLDEALLDLPDRVLPAPRPAGPMTRETLDLSWRGQGGG